MPKTASQTYADLASAHRNLHAILLNTGQPISEKDKCAALIKALNKDAAGMYAAQLYAQSYSLIHTRTFNGLVTHIDLHAHNAILTTGTMHYAAAAIVSPVPALGASDTAALHAEKAQLKKEIHIVGSMVHVSMLAPNVPSCSRTKASIRRRTSTPRQVTRPQEERPDGWAVKEICCSLHLKVLVLI